MRTPNDGIICEFNKSNLIDYVLRNRLINSRNIVNIISGIDKYFFSSNVVKAEISHDKRSFLFSLHKKYDDNSFMLFQFDIQINKTLLSVDINDSTLSCNICDRYHDTYENIWNMINYDETIQKSEFGKHISYTQRLKDIEKNLSEIYSKAKSFADTTISKCLECETYIHGKNITYNHKIYIPSGALFCRTEICGEDGKVKELLRFRLPIPMLDIKDPQRQYNTFKKYFKHIEKDGGLTSILMDIKKEI